MPDEDAPKDMAVLCPRCDATVIGKPHGYTIDRNPENGPPNRFTLLQCPRAHTMLVIHEEYGGNTRFDDDPPYRMYPPQDRRLSNEIPERLRSAHDEARKCFHAKSYVGAVAMCGRTLEAACAEHDIDEGTLDKSLEEMKERQIIDGRLWEWAKTLKDVRNAAAHLDKKSIRRHNPITRQDAEDSLALSEALLDYLYVLSARFEAMKARRAGA
jgi:hypothetical protein